VAIANCPQILPQYTQIRVKNRSRQWSSRGQKLYKNLFVPGLGLQRSRDLLAGGEGARSPSPQELHPPRPFPAHRLPSLEKILRAPVSTPVHHVLCISPFFFVLFTAATTDAVRALSLRRWLQLRFDCKKLHYTIRRPTSRSGCCALRPK